MPFHDCVTNSVSLLLCIPSSVFIARGIVRHVTHFIARCLAACCEMLYVEFFKNFCKLSDTEICFVWHLFCPHLFCLQVFTSILAVALLPLAESYSSFQDSIPNGRNVLNPCNQMPWPGVGHRAIQGGGQKNLFGDVGVFVVLYQVFKSLSFSFPPPPFLFVPPLSLFLLL